MSQGVLTWRKRLCKVLGTILMTGCRTTRILSTTSPQSLQEKWDWAEEWNRLVINYAEKNLGNLKASVKNSLQLIDSTERILPMFQHRFIGWSRLE